MIIDELSEIIIQNDLPLLCLAVYENGSEYERAFSVANDCNNVYSVSKSFTAAAVGILFDKGVLAPDTRIKDFFEPQHPALWSGVDKRWNDVTVKHLLTHTTGHNAMLLDVDCDDVLSYGTEDYLKKVLTHPLSFAPGSQFAYSDSNYYLLSRIVAYATGQRLQDFVAKNILTPLKVQGFAWTTCPHGHAMGATRLFITVRDMLRFGRMLANGGVYDGKRILSEQFIDEATKPHAVKNDDTFYGYSFWMRGGYDLFYCSGMLGQKIFVDRKKGRVVSWQAYDKHHKTDILTDYLYSNVI